MIGQRRKIRNNFQVQNTKWYLKYVNEPNVFIYLLYWMGLLEDSDTTLEGRVTHRIVLAIFMLVSLDVVVITVLRAIYDSNLRELLIFMNTYILGLFIFLEMRRKRMFMSVLLRMLQEVQPHAEKKKTCNLFYSICIAHVIPIVLHASSKFRAQTAWFLAYCNLINDPHNQVLLILLKGTANSILYPIFPTLVLFFLCMLCQRICYEIRHLTSEISKVSPNEFTVSKQVDILRSYRKVEDILNILQNLFYSSSFFICMANFCFCCTQIGWVVGIYGLENDWTLLTLFFLQLACSAASLLACLWVVGGLPIEMQVFIKEFLQKIEHRTMLRGREDEVNFGRRLDEKSVFVLSGCDIIHFERSSILALAASVLTYTLLLMKY
ncbi:hypothetical protein AVEN_245095-1 [Araneus ventricosus]|uniref:Gustatory receptor n=1 Tax=Araneus ventricosus TaxID=182803 RepID=A0A4Y2SJ79_ARAVE|nr:hypothetical protein AVEN_245095-1 [Araneus ventricosus]